MSMIRNLFFTFFILHQCFCFSQDLIYLKNKTIQEGKVVEVTTEKIKYKKAEIANSPTYELLKNEVVKITYPSGYTDIFDTSFANKTLPTLDSANFSIIYVLFHYGQDDSQVFPLYFNGQYICTMRNHMRMKFKIYSDGVLSCERRSGKNFGPKANLVIVHGKIYGISIDVPYPYALDPNKRFSLRTYNIRNEVDEFLKKRFYHFKTYNKDLDLKEDIKNPICIK
jgi:hypothetical protein